MKLQEKASSAKTLFIINFIKSIIRLIECGALYYGCIPLAALLIGGAELLGIAEEVFLIKYQIKILILMNYFLILKS